MASINPMYYFAVATPPPTSNSIRFIDMVDFFFIAHPSSSVKEGDEYKRNMYYFPKGELVDKQTEVTGFAEAVMNFTQNFLPSRTDDQNSADEFEFRTVSTQKSEHVYIKVEGTNFIMGIALSKHLAQVSNYPLFQPALRSVLCDSYKLFRMIFGRFSELWAINEAKFKERLDLFYSKYLPLLRVHRIPLLDTLGGVEFLPLSGPLYLNIVSMIAELQEEFPLLDKVVFFYQDKLLYYSLSSRDLPSMFRYLTQHLLPMNAGPELEPHTFSTSRSSSKGRFLRGPSDLTTDASLLGDELLPVIYLHTKRSEQTSAGAEEEEEILQKYQMIVYRYLNATVCIFVRDPGDRHSNVAEENNDPSVVSRRLLRNIDAFLETELGIIASKIGDEVGGQNELRPEATDFHYIYFNPSSLSMTSSFATSSIAAFGTAAETNVSLNLPRAPSPPFDVNRLLCETMANFVSETEEFGECFAKSVSDWWVVIKKVNSRLLVLLLPPSSHQQSLADVKSRTQTIVKSYFKAIFFN